MEVWFLRVHPPGQSLRIPGRGSRARRERGGRCAAGGWPWRGGSGSGEAGAAAGGGGGAEACAELGLALPHALALARDLRGRGGLWTVAAPPPGRERAGAREPPRPPHCTHGATPLCGRAPCAPRGLHYLLARRGTRGCVCVDRCAYKAPRKWSPKVSHDLKITQSRDCNGHGQWQEDGRKLLRIDRAPRPP